MNQEGDVNRAVVLLSGGLDSATALAIAQQDYQVFALSFDYGQRHKGELHASQSLAKAFAVEHRIAQLDLSWMGGSALTDQTIPVPHQSTQAIPMTYVPARNTVFLSVALAWAEVLQARHIFIGVNAIDYSGYPDCRPEYIEAFQTMANLATRVGVEGRAIKIETPLIRLSKSEIIKTGTALGVDYGLTLSCYQPDSLNRACGCCEACQFRKSGFLQAGVADPTEYQGE